MPHTLSLSPDTPLNIASLCLEENLRLRPDKEALVFVEEGRVQRFTFREIVAEVSALSTQFRTLKMESGSRVLIRLPNSPGFAFSSLAAMACGFVAVPLSPQLTREEVGFLLHDTRASLLCTTEEMPNPTVLPKDCSTLILPSDKQRTIEAGLSLHIAATTADTAAYLVYTSGTTGRPKGVLHGHRSLLGREPMRRGWTGIEEYDRVLHAGQLNWTYTMGVGLMDPWRVGASVVLYNGPKDPTVWARLIEEWKVTIFAAVPSVYRQLLKYTPALEGRCPSLRHGLTAGEALSPTLLDRWQKVMNRPLFEALGMSECSTYVSSGPETPVCPGSPGKPQKGRNIAILPTEGGTEPLSVGEIGLLAIHRSEPGLMLGYWERPEEEAEVFRGEWFVGGDLAHLDEHGYLWFHGRDDDVMNAFGYRVSPLEVEKTLLTHPAIHEVAVTEFAVRKEVSVIAAFVVLRDEMLVGVEELDAFVHEHLAAYKCPREYRFVKELPRTSSGKIQRSRLKEGG